VALIHGLVLAGGASRRMGRPKALLTLDDETFVAGLVRRLRAAGCARVVVAAGAHAAHIAPHAPTVEVSDWRRGMRATLAAGLRALPPGPVLLTHCDRPCVAPATLAALAAQPDDAPWVPTFRDAPGHPVRLPAWLRPRLLRPDDVPLRAVLARAGARRLPVRDPDILLNVNTPAAYGDLRGRGCIDPMRH
jgi:CTP:molybdopterin cytidylyltransferase MocA